MENETNQSDGEVEIVRVGAVSVKGYAIHECEVAPHFDIAVSFRRKSDGWQDVQLLAPTPHGTVSLYLDFEQAAKLAQLFRGAPVNGSA